MMNPYLFGLAASWMIALAPADRSTFDAMDHRMPAAAKDAIIAAVASDPEMPITGSLKGDALLAAVYMQHESFFKRNAVGDHGSSLGSMQLQGVPKELAFDYRLAVEEWLRRAHASFNDCSGRVEPGAELAELASGSCNRGRLIARTRWREAGDYLTFAVDDADAIARE